MFHTTEPPSPHSIVYGQRCSVAPNHYPPHPCSEALTPSPNTQEHPVVSLTSKGKSPSGEYLVASRELSGVSTGAESHTPALVKLAGIYMKWRYVREGRNGSGCEWILTKQRAGNSHCGTVIDAFRRERILTLNKREWLYLFLSKLHQETGIITAGTYSKSGEFRIQMTCLTGLSLRADSSQTGTQNLSADESIRPAT